MHDVKHHSVWKLDFVFLCEWHSSAYDLLTIAAAQPYDITAEEESKCNTGHEHQSSLPFSSNIRCLVFPRGDITRFKPARLAYWIHSLPSVLLKLQTDSIFPHLPKARQVQVVGLLPDGRSICVTLSRFGCPRRSQCAGPLCSSRGQNSGSTSVQCYRWEELCNLSVFIAHLYSFLNPEETGSKSKFVVGNPPFFIIYATGFLCVNDCSVSRTLRLKRVLHSYIPKQFLTDEKLRITSFDGTKWGEIERNTFDRVCFSYFEPELIAFAWSNNPDAKTVFTPCFLSGPCWRPLHHRQTLSHGEWQQYIQ